MIIAGLIIIQAWYGNVKKEAEGDTQDGNSSIVDVTVPLQYLVEESQLHLQGGPKAGLLGFFDPCPDEDKQLYIRYLFQDKLHHVTIQEWEALDIPKKKDIVQ
jgi:DnaJ family protein C protein 11